MKKPIKNIINSKRIFMMLTAVLFMMLIALSTFSTHDESHVVRPSDLFNPYPLDREFNPRVLWYVEFCREWGGTKIARSGARVTGKPLFISQTTVTLQAINESFPDGDKIYKVSYYVQPFGGPADYAIRLINSVVEGAEGRIDLVAKTRVEDGDTKSGFIVTDPTDKLYNLSLIRIDDTPDNGVDDASVLVVPVVGETYTGTCDICGIGFTGDPWEDDWV